MKVRSLFATAIMAVCFVFQSFALTQITSDNYSTYNLTDSYVDYYIISTADDLIEFEELVNSGNYSINAVLVSDIVLNEGLFDADGNFQEEYAEKNAVAFTPIGNHVSLVGDDSEGYKGIFDGNNHTITGLYINMPTKNMVGMFGQIGNSGSVRNLTLSEGYVNAKTGAMLVGECIGGRIVSCVVESGLVKASAGIVGSMTNAIVGKCVNKVTIIGLDDVGGICGDAYSSTIDQCVNAGKVSTIINSINGSVGGICGFLDDSKVYNCINIGNVYGIDRVGGVVGRSYATTTDAAEVSYCVNVGFVGGGTSVGDVVGIEDGDASSLFTSCYYANQNSLHGGLNDADVIGKIEGVDISSLCSSTLLTGYGSSFWNAGSSVATDIERTKGMFGRKAVGKLISLKNIPTTDIDFTAYEEYYDFGTSDTSNWQLYKALLSIADLKKIANDTYGNYVMLNDIQLLDNLNADGSIQTSPSVTWSRISDFYGRFSGDGHTISGLYGEGLFSQLGNTNGLIENLGITNCLFVAESDDFGAFCKTMVGGIIRNCYNASNITSTYLNTAGLVGNMHRSSYSSVCRIENCWNTGKIDGHMFVGGLVGEANIGEIVSCYNTGKIQSDLVYAGGICGLGSSSISMVAVFNFGDIIAMKGTAGGLSASTAKSLDQSYNAGYIADYVASGLGSICSSGDAANVTNCYYVSDITSIKGIGDADTEGSTAPITILEICNGTLPIGFSSDYWAIKEPEIIDAQKVYYYPYLKGIGTQSAQVGYKKTVSKVQLNANGGHYSLNDDITEYVEGEETILPTDVSRNGYDFDGWYSNSNFTSEVCTKISSTATGTQFFYAKWNAKVYSITFEISGGTINSGNVSSYVYGNTVILPSDVVRTGYTFEGWYGTDDFSDERVYQIALSDFGDKTFYAKWSQVDYTIIYNANEGSFSETPTDVYNYGTEIVLPIPTRTGYVFLGWYNNSNLIGTSITTITNTEYGNKEFWAKWEAEIYTVELQTNGGEINSGNVTSYTYNVLTLLPSDVTRTGYTFCGWLYREDNMMSIVSQIEKGTIGNKVYTAMWIPKEYSVILQTNGGVVKSGNIDSYEYGETVALPTNVAYTGYTFEGWYSNSSFMGNAVEEIPAGEYGDKTYYAKWIANTYSISMYAAGGEVNATVPTEYTYGTLTLLPSDVTRTGYTFSGWYEAMMGKASITSITTETFDEVKAVLLRYEKKSFVEQIMPDQSINAVEFKVPSYIIPNLAEDLGYIDVNVTFAVNGASMVLSRCDVSLISFGDNPTSAVRLVKSYFGTIISTAAELPITIATNVPMGTFNQFNSELEAINGESVMSKEYAEDDLEPVVAIYTTDNEDKYYEAHWTVNTYKVTLEVNGGTNTNIITSYTYGKSVNLPNSEEITREGYTFVGWYTSSNFDGDVHTEIEATETGDKTYYAKWKIKEYNIVADYDTTMGVISGEGSYEYKTSVKLKAVANDGYEFVNWNNETTDNTISFVVTKDSTLVANFKEKEKVLVVGALEIPTLKTEREAQPIDLSGLFTTTEGNEITYTATSSAPNIVSASVVEGQLVLTVFALEGNAEIMVTALLPNGEQNSVKATAEVVPACNIQVADSITNVSCFGENDGAIALAITNIAEPYTVQWIGKTDTTNTISNLVNGNYTVSIVDAEGCTFQKTYTLTQPNEIGITKSLVRPTCNGSNGAIIVNVTGGSDFTYVWNNDTTSQNLTNIPKGEYNLVVINNETGCKAETSVLLTEPEVPVVEVMDVVETACNEKNGAIIVSGSDNLIYHWSNGRATKNLTSVPAGDYTLIVTDENNCKDTIDVTVPSIKLKQPEISLVTVSEQTGKNLVVWLKENTELIDYYTIYRESDRKDVFEEIATVPYSELSVYEDTDADPNIQSWRYKISATDVCGEETDLSDYHTTMHIAKVAGAETEENENQTVLLWNAYEGIDYESFIVMCKHKVNGKILVDTLATISANFTSYTIDTVIENVISYYVGIRLPKVINPKTQFMKAESGPFSLAISNIAEVENDGNQTAINVVESNVKVYTIGHTIYVKNAENQEIAIYDNEGRCINHTPTANANMENEYMIRTCGVYFVVVGNESFTVVVK